MKPIRIAVLLLTAIACVALSPPTTLQSQELRSKRDKKSELPEIKIEKQDWGYQVTTEHYALRMEKVSEAKAREYGLIAERMYAGFKAFFAGNEPRLKKNQKLVGKYLKDYETFQKAVKDDGGALPESGGLYLPHSKVFYLYPQPSEYNTRQLFIHEALHQFHYLAMTNNNRPKNFWYIEGLAEHISRHHWDGKTLTLCEIPLLTRTHFAEKALAELGKDDFDIDAFLKDNAIKHRSLSWAIVRYLSQPDKRGRIPKKWTQLCKLMDSGFDGLSSYKRSFGKTAKLKEELLEWLPSQDEPFREIWVEWQSRGPSALEGHAKVTGACRATKSLKSIEARLLKPEGDHWIAGLLLDYKDNDEYIVAKIMGGKHVDVSRRTDGKWISLANGLGIKPANKDGSFDLKATRDGKGKVTLSIRGQQLKTFDTQGEYMGLMLENCRARFTDIKVEADKNTKDGKK